MAKSADWACEGASALGAVSAAKLHDEIVEIEKVGLTNHEVHFDRSQSLKPGQTLKIEV